MAALITENVLKNMAALPIRSELYYYYYCMVIIVIIIVPCNYSAGAVRFQHSAFSRPGDVSNITFVAPSPAWYQSGRTAFFSRSDSAIWLTPLDPNATKDPTDVGRVVYKQPIQFVGAASSFSTSFTFRIITTRPYGYGGSGMAFFISDSLQPAPNSDTMGALGLVDPNNLGDPAQSHFFAVEFDTSRSPTFQDPSDSHIGIDIASLESYPVIDTSPGSSFYPDLFLYNNYTFTAWIEYNASNSLIRVWMVKINGSTVASTPEYTSQHEPLLQAQYNLSTVFLDRNMYVGFTATSAPQTRGLEGHLLYAWNFTNELQPYPVDTANIGRPSARLSKAALAGIVSAVVAVILIICGVIICMRLVSRLRDVSTRSSAKDNLQLALRGIVQNYSYKQLRKATGGFSNKNKVGEGGFSTVYRGTLPDGSTVAVKKLKASLKNMEAEFCTEMSIISKVRHAHLVELHGWCYERGEAFLVYEYMANGSLDKHLFNRSGEYGSLDGEARWRVLVAMAAALEYLHEGLEECVLHRDVKPANVLLAGNFTPKLGDFGLARLIARSGQSGITMTPAGTPGCIAPELVYTGRATAKADVFSFGVLALQLASGRPATDSVVLVQDRTTAKSEENIALLADVPAPDHQEMQLLDWVWLLYQRNQLPDQALDPTIRAQLERAAPVDAVDVNINDDGDDRVLVAADQRTRWRCALHVALMCCHPSPDARPTMRQVTQYFEDPSRVLGIPLAKPPSYPAYIRNKQTLNVISSSSSTSHSIPTSSRTTASTNSESRALSPR